jgi:hypothetical protein
MTNQNPPDKSNTELTDLEKRVKRLEDKVFNGGGGGTAERLNKIEKDLADIRATYATKAELDEAYEILASLRAGVESLKIEVGILQTQQPGGTTWPPS